MVNEVKKSVFETLSEINVSSRISKKVGGGGHQLSYLSWVWAWGVVKSIYPDASYRVYESPTGLNYFSDGRTAYVKCSVTIQGEEIVEYLPVMEASLKSMPVDKMTSHDVIRATQRCITKAIARHGLGLYIYAGEDMPSDYVPEDKSADIIAEVKAAATKDELVRLWQTCPEYHGHDAVVAAFAARKKEVS